MNLTRRKAWLGCLGVILCTLAVVGFISWHYALSPAELPEAAARALAAPVLGGVHRQDLVEQRRLVAGYYVGGPREPGRDPAASWQALKGVRLEGGSALRALPDAVPFVYDSPEAPPLRELARRYRLKELVGAGGEYDQMLRLARWLGTRWDHGVDPVPGDAGCPNPGAVIAAGEKGARFWCEIAARAMVQAATALGWPARLVTGSTDGYHWDHALAEIWSNQFNKWILFDPDYNILYASGGVPLSAFEICHMAPTLSRQGALEVVRFAPLKKSLKDLDLLFLYRYVHIDLRNDWLSRRLAPGSPAGGDAATYWTARPGLEKLLTAKARVDDKERFDWRVNAVALYAVQMVQCAPENYRLTVGISGYTPYFRGFEVRLAGEPWQRADQGRWEVPLRRGRHRIESRVITSNGASGPVYRVDFSL